MRLAKLVVNRLSRVLYRLNGAVIASYYLTAGEIPAIEHNAKCEDFAQSHMLNEVADCLTTGLFQANSSVEAA